MRYDIRRYWQAIQYWYLYQYNKVIASTSTLLNDLVSYWKLDETTGTRFDSFGSNDLTDNNTVGSTTGIIGNAASFVPANSEYLNVATTRDLELQAGDNMSVSVWVYPTVNDATIRMPLSKQNSAFGEWALWLRNGTAELRIYYSGTSTSTGTVTCPANTWSFLVLEFANSGGLLVPTIYNVGAGTSGTLAPIAYPTDFSGDFVLGSLQGSSFFYDGKIDEVGNWKRVLTAGERTNLYNSGSGFTYPFV